MEKMRYILRIIERYRYGIPKYLKQEWFAISRYSDFKLPVNFDEDKKFITYKKGDLVAMKNLPEGKAAFYKITNISWRRGDWLYDSDAYSYDLVYSHIDKSPNP